MNIDMRALVIVAALSLLALPAAAQITCCYSWEDGGTILGSYGANLVDATNVTGIQVGVQGSAVGITCPGANDGLVIEGRLYSTPSTDPTMRTDFFIDYICVTAPTTACISFPQVPNPVEDSSWTTIKALYR